MRISKLACLSPPPFAPIETEPGVFVLRQVLDRERILARVANVMLTYMMIIILLGLFAQALHSMWPNLTIWILNLILSILPYPLLIVGWLLWTLINFARYFTERSRTRVVRIEKRSHMPHAITINDRCMKGQLFACEVSIRRADKLFARPRQFLAICVESGGRVKIVVCTENTKEIEVWQARLEVDWVHRETELALSGMF